MPPHSIVDLLDDLVEVVPSSFRYPDVAAARISCGSTVATTDGFEPVDTRLTARAETADGTAIEIDVVYLEDRPPEDLGPFLDEEQTALDTFVELVRRYLERGNVGRSSPEPPERTGDPNEAIERYRRLLDEHELVLDRMTDVFTALDADWRITYLNEGGRQAIVGPLDDDPSKGELIGRHFWSINPSFTEEEMADTELYKTCHEAMERQEMASHETYHEKAGFWVYTRVYPSETGVSIFSRDITDRKRKEQKLERQVERLTEYQRQVERLEEFAGVVSHDLRNPLNVARGYLEQTRETGNLELLDEVDRSHDRMAALIEELLLLAREGDEIEADEVVDLSELVADCWGTVETVEATLRVDVERSVLTDRTRLAQLFENLFRNAVEHSSTSPRPAEDAVGRLAPDEPSVADAPEDAVEHAGSDVTIAVAPLDDGFYVEDDGPGIPPEDRDRVFEAGYSTNEAGTGFGLGIVAEIADAHGWDVSVTDGADGGARFEFTGVEFTGAEFTQD